MPKAAMPKVTDTANSIISANGYSEVSQLIYTLPCGVRQELTMGWKLSVYKLPPPYLKGKSGISRALARGKASQESF